MVTFGVDQEIGSSGSLSERNKDLQNGEGTVDGAGELSNSKKGTMFGKLFGVMPEKEINDKPIKSNDSNSIRDQENQTTKKGISFGDEIHHDNNFSSRPLTSKSSSSPEWVPSGTAKLIIDLLSTDAKQLDKIQENVQQYIQGDVMNTSKTNIRNKRFSMHTKASTLNQEWLKETRQSVIDRDEQEDLDLQLAMSPKGHKRMSILFKMEKKPPPADSQVMKNYVKVVDEISSKWKESTMVALDALKYLECAIDAKQKQLSDKKKIFEEKEEAVKSTKASNGILKKYLTQLELQVAALGSAVDLNERSGGSSEENTSEREISGYIQEGLYDDNWSNKAMKEEKHKLSATYIDKILQSDCYVDQTINNYKAITELTSSLSTSTKNSQENSHIKITKHASPSIEEYVEELQYLPPSSSNKFNSSATPKSRSTPKSEAYSLYYHQPEGIKEPLNPNPHLVQFMDTETTRTVNSNQTVGSTLGSSSSGATYLSIKSPSVKQSHLSTSSNPNHYTNTHNYNLFDYKSQPYSGPAYFDRSTLSRPPTKLFRKPASPTKKDASSKLHLASPKNYNNTGDSKLGDSRSSTTKEKKRFPYLKVNTSPKEKKTNQIDYSPKRTIESTTSPRGMPNYKISLSPKSVKSYSPRNAFTKTSAFAHLDSKQLIKNTNTKLSPRALDTKSKAISPRVYKFDAEGKQSQEIITVEVLARIHAFTRMNNIAENDFVKYMLLHGENIIIPERLIETMGKMGVHLSTAEARTICSTLSIDKKSAAISLDRFVEAVYDPPSIPVKENHSKSNNVQINPSLSNTTSSTKSTVIDITGNPALKGLLDSTVPKKLGDMAYDVRRRLSRDEREKGFDNKLVRRPETQNVFSRETALNLKRIEDREDINIPQPPEEVEMIFKTIASHCAHGKEDLNRIYEMQDIHKTGWVTYDEMGSTLCAFGTFVCASETKKVARWMLPLRDDNLIYIDDIMYLVEKYMRSKDRLYRNTVRFTSPKSSMNRKNRKSPQGISGTDSLSNR